MQSRGVRRPSVCPSVCKLFCANRFFYHRSGWITTNLAHDGPQKSPHPGCAQGQGQRSRDMDTFLTTRKSLLLPQTWLDRHQTYTRWSPDGPASSCALSQGQGQRSRDTDTFVISQKSLLLAGKWLECYQTCTWWFPAQRASRVCSRSRSRLKVTWYGHFCDVTKCLLYSTVSRSVSTCAHFMKPYSPSSISIRQLDV